jgi:hypothetical protein
MIRRSSRGREAAAAAAPGSCSDATNFCEFLYERISCLRVRPGCDGNLPSDSGTVGMRPGVRSGSSAEKPRGPSSFSARALSSSFPSPWGTVRARNTLIRTESRSVQVGGGVSRAGSSPGISPRCVLT